MCPVNQKSVESEGKIVKKSFRNMVIMGLFLLGVQRLGSTHEEK
jgi:hypothetical protein